MLHHIPVEGGTLAVDILTSDAVPVLALHGVSSNRKLWSWVHAQAPDISLIAPDLRGRADSFGVTGPFSLRQHTEDLIRVLDTLNIDRVVVCGMSMGGFVGVDFATSHPDRVSDLVLVDGGLPMYGHIELKPEMVRASLGPQLAVLERKWPSLDEYVDLHVSANSLLSAADPLFRDYLGHFLAADGRVRLDPDALIADAKDVFFAPSRWQELTVPTQLVYAEWSVDRNSPPAYSPEAVAEFESNLPCLAPPRRVTGVDHGGLMWTKTGAAAVAEVLAEIGR